MLLKSRVKPVVFCNMRYAHGRGRNHCDGTCISDKGLMARYQQSHYFAGDSSLQPLRWRSKVAVFRRPLLLTNSP